ncbi:MAG: transcriptional regulator [Chitinophagaceae bacterium]|nr:MAG: transcriptional regulator [Chitinophagaceae bacterium]
MIAFKGRTYTCPIDVTFSFINGKWKVLILSHLYRYKKRSYSEIRDNLPRISEKMLSQQLKEMEADELIVKKTISSKPYRVEYALAKNGKAFSPIMEFASKWGIRYLKANGIDYLKDQELYK